MFSHVLPSDARGGRVYKCVAFNPIRRKHLGGSYTRISVTGEVLTSGPNLPTSGPNLPTSSPNLPTSGPNILTSGPNMLTSGPNILTSGPNILTSGPDILSHKQVFTNFR